MERWVVWQRYNIPPVIRVRFPPLPFREAGLFSLSNYSPRAALTSPRFHRRSGLLRAKG